ncbi:MAG: cell wall hydrolase [Clostridia bacterium]|nr:cell wall hydrolase [Clostridia bacterium]
MQPTGTVYLRRVALIVLFISSLVAIMVMGSRAQADGDTSEDAVIAEKQVSQLTEQITAEAQAIETRDNKIALYSNYLQLTGLVAEYDGDDVVVPVVLFSEAMSDCTVSYTKKTVEIKAEGLTIEASVGEKYIVANNKYIYVEGGVVLREDGHIWTSIDVMSKIFGCEYSFDAESKSVHLTLTGEYISAEKSYTSKDLYWLARIINAESRGESFVGKLAVGTVVMNRVASSRYPNSVYGVIFDRGQFTPAESGSVYMTPLEDCVTAARIVLDGYRISDSILFFHSIRNPKNYASFVNTEQEMVIGNHYFYTDYSRR